MYSRKLINEKEKDEQKWKTIIFECVNILNK